MSRPSTLLLAIAALILASARMVASEPLVTAEQIQSAPAEWRTRIVGCVAATLADDSRVAGRLQREDRAGREAREATLQAAIDELEARAKSVRRAMRAADRAPEESWPDARARLADAFASYSVVMQRLTALAHATQPTPSERVIARARTHGGPGAEAPSPDLQ